MKPLQERQFPKEKVTVRVIHGGLQTLVEDWPGRTGYRKRGIAVSGALDDIAYRAANLLVGNPIGDLAGNPVGEACLEIRGGFFQAEFTEDTAIAITGANMNPTINNVPTPMWETIRISPGDKIKFETCKEAGFTTYLAIAGGIDVPLSWGSKSTCTKESYGGFQGRALRPKDELKIGKPKAKLSNLEGRKFRKDLIPEYHQVWDLRATPGPRSAPDYFTEEGMDMWFSQPLKITLNANRTAYRLENPKPIFARTNGGIGGIHPSNVLHDPYREPGALNVCGDFGILLLRDTNTTGGFVCPLTVILADLWKIGQAMPGRDSVKFIYCSLEEAAQALAEREAMFTEESLE